MPDWRGVKDCFGEPQHYLALVSSTTRPWAHANILVSAKKGVQENLGDRL